MTFATKLPSYLLLTPGPLSTSPSVRQAMLYDSCTWDKDYKSIVSAIRSKLLAIAGCDPAEYTTVLMQGSGTFGVEAVLGSCLDPAKHKILILVNGVYGQRMVSMAKILHLPHHVYEIPENETFDADGVRDVLMRDETITHIAMVHCETTTGILNDLNAIAAIAEEHDKYFIVDAMSSFGGIEFDVVQLGIDFLVSSANKCIQGAPGFSFVICKKNALIELCQGQAKSLSLDLYNQWEEMERDPGKWRYTSPTHVVLAFYQALIEFEEEGGVAARSRRYRDNQILLTQGMEALGFEAYIATNLQSPIITTFLQPEKVPATENTFSFTEFYEYLKSCGYVIYPGKITNRNTFRIGNIGNIFSEDIKLFLDYVNSFIKSYRLELL